MSAFFYLCFMKYLVFAFFFMFSDFLYSQDTLMPIIFLDDVVISEENNGFSVEDFVSYVRQDSSFYMGFKYLRYYSHKYDSKLTIFNKQGDKVCFKRSKLGLAGILRNNVCNICETINGCKYER